MKRVWINAEKGDDKIIAVAKDKILKANPKAHNLHQYEVDIMNDRVADDVFGIPFQYIKSIQLQDNKKYIQVYFGQESEEHIRIRDDARRQEVFDSFKEIIPNTTYKVEKFCNTSAVKKPLIAMAVIFLLFLWTVILAAGIESGNEYEVVGNQRSVASVVLLVAGLGILKVLIIYGSFMALAVYSLVRKMRNKTNIHTILIAR